MRLQRAMCDFAVEHSFAAATQRLREHYGFDLGASAFREVTLENARRARQKVEAESAKSFRELPASAHKHVLQKRLKISGAAWLPESIEAIAQLRILRANGRWDELWPLAA